MLSFRPFITISKTNEHEKSKVSCHYSHTVIVAKQLPGSARQAGALPSPPSSWVQASQIEPGLNKRENEEAFGSYDLKAFMFLVTDCKALMLRVEEEVFVVLLFLCGVICIDADTEVGPAVGVIIAGLEQGVGFLVTV